MTTVCPKCGASVPIPLRSTGKFSANHATFGFADQIAKWIEDGTTKWDVLEEAMARSGIGTHVNRFGRVVPDKHESQLTKPESHLVIEALRDIAQFLGVRLVEVTE